MTIYIKNLNNLIDKLLADKLIITTAESCTGGLLASILTELPGSSAWFEQGYITYSNVAKQQMLGVEQALLNRYGAVSLEVAKAMAIGALEHSTADVSIAVTGIAGPSGGSDEKPVGTVCFAFASRGKSCQSYRHFFAKANRQQIRLLACNYALEQMVNFLSS